MRAEEIRRFDEPMEAEAARSRAAYFEETFSPQDFWAELGRAGGVSPEAEARLRDERFCYDVLVSLDTFEGDEAVALYRLLRLGCINLRSSSFLEFLRLRPSLLAKYLALRLKKDRGCFMEDSLRPLVRLAIEGTLQRQGESRQVFGILWSELRGEEWEWLWFRLSEMQGRLPEGTLTEFFNAFVEISEGEGRRAAEKLRASFDALEYEAVLELFPASNDVIRRNLLHTLMRSFSRTAREYRTAQRRINGESRRAFTALYQEVEALEKLATRPSVARKELVACVQGLREGLADLGIDALEVGAEWEKREPMPFDPARHELQGMGKPKQVVLQTRGFLYQDEEGEVRRYLAKVEAWQKPAQSEEKQPKAKGSPSKKTVSGKRRDEAGHAAKEKA